jgi:hypothetical protein
MSLSVRLIGYDKETDRLKIEYKIPDGLLPQVLIVADIRQRPSDPIVDYPLTEAKAVRLNSLLGKKMNRSLDYFIEVTATEGAYS